MLDPCYWLIASLPQKQFLRVLGTASRGGGVIISKRGDEDLGEPSDGGEVTKIRQPLMEVDKNLLVSRG